MQHKLKNILEPFKTTFFVLPTDLDFNFHMNHTLNFTITEFARIAFCIRTPLLSNCRKRGYGMVLGGTSFQFRREINAFNLVTCHSQFVAIDDRWLFVEHNLYVGKKFVGKGVAKFCVTTPKEKQSTASAEVVARELIGCSEEQIQILKKNASEMSIIQTFRDHDMHLKEPKQQ